VPARSRKASSIDSGSTCRRQRLHQRADFAPDTDVFFHVWRDHHGFRAQFERLEHRHGRAHALDAGDVAGGGDDATPAAADDHRPVLQAGLSRFSIAA